MLRSTNGTNATIRSAPKHFGRVRATNRSKNRAANSHWASAQDGKPARQHRSPQRPQSKRRRNRWQ
ncbi:hypothetical protein Bcep22_gp04 [Burkholderia phage Bcep22]|uniref:Uncharacterized protein n=1 Tax=Burkholderia phage Bcep22 TaxID=2883944 RepID=A8YQQ4_9CAUD|nr:hypothetical protein Bcep22_gp04 [Burkholderia phage Bcep22]ABW74907.1 hypothetical protein Bcep22_gp04 [Burkholderia phage Bcep22]